MGMMPVFPVMPVFVAMTVISKMTFMNGALILGTNRTRVLPLLPDTYRGLLQTVSGKVSDIMTFGGRGVESLTLSLAFTLQNQ